MTTGFVAILEPDQVVHVETLISVLKRFPYAIDTTLMGGGKSFAAAAVAERLRFGTVVIVCPASLEHQWTSLLDTPEYKIETITRRVVVSYESLRSDKCATTHGLLVKNDAEFACSPKLSEMIASGALFIFDEAHRLKNDVLTTKAVGVITRSIAASFETSPTRYLLLSGTLYDQASHAITLMVTLGIMSSREVCRVDRSIRTVKLTGGAELIDFVKRRIMLKAESDPDPDIGQREVTCASAAEEFVLNVVSEFVLPAISSTMVLESEVSNDDREARVRSIDCANLIADLRKTEALGFGGERASYSSRVKHLAEAVGYGTTNKINLGAFMRAIRELEIAKAPTVARLALDALAAERAKVVIVAKYRHSIDVIESILKDKIGGVVVVNGSMAPVDRVEVFKAFQQPTPEVRVIIATLDIIALGVNLDDQSGEWPRFMFAMPSFYAINMHQLIRRIYRRFTIGKATVRIVYGATQSGMGFREDLIMRSGAQKAKNIRGTMRESAARKILFADQYATIDEEGRELDVVVTCERRKTLTRPRYAKAFQSAPPPPPPKVDLKFLFGVRSV